MSMSAIDIIKQLGGIRQTARLMDLHAGTVQGWWRRNNIPTKYNGHIATLLAKHQHIETLNAVAPPTKDTATNKAAMRAQDTKKQTQAAAKKPKKTAITPPQNIQTDTMIDSEALPPKTTPIHNDTNNTITSGKGRKNTIYGLVCVAIFGVLLFSEPLWRAASNQYLQQVTTWLNIPYNTPMADDGLPQKIAIMRGDMNILIEQAGRQQQSIATLGTLETELSALKNTMQKNSAQKDTATSHASFAQIAVIEQKLQNVTQELLAVKTFMATQSQYEQTLQQLQENTVSMQNMITSYQQEVTKNIANITTTLQQIDGVQTKKILDNMVPFITLQSYLLLGANTAQLHVFDASITQNLWPQNRIIEQLNYMQYYYNLEADIATNDSSIQDRVMQSLLQIIQIENEQAQKTDAPSLYVLFTTRQYDMLLQELQKLQGFDAVKQQIVYTQKLYNILQQYQQQLPITAS